MPLLPFPGLEKSLLQSTRLHTHQEMCFDPSGCGLFDGLLESENEIESVIVIVLGCGVCDVRSVSVVGSDAGDDAGEAWSMSVENSEVGDRELDRHAAAVGIAAVSMAVGMTVGVGVGGVEEEVEQ
ncbi:hypothetical protein G7Y89_g5059 [Cudoniella acicularis]|uniref:Uncharacterized protein n=1 Tax=Cudoniella acicularis TaxID=354080 RepID=A0A8H4W6U4_9HELO|nr:hypothetical protein G7Y89_g5059 [Cudoniella acicularis]